MSQANEQKRVGRPRAHRLDGEKIESLLAAEGRKLNWLAEKAAISKHHLWSIRRGEVGASDQTLGRIAEALGVTGDCLLKASGE